MQSISKTFKISMDGIQRTHQHDLEFEPSRYSEYAYRKARGLHCRLLTAIGQRHIGRTQERRKEFICEASKLPTPGNIGILTPPILFSQLFTYRSCSQRTFQTTDFTCKLQPQHGASNNVALFRGKSPKYWLCLVLLNFSIVIEFGV